MIRLAFTIAIAFLAFAAPALADGTLTAPSVAAFRNSSGAVVPVACDKTAGANATAATSAQIVALAAGKSIYVCSFTLGTQATAGTATTFQWFYGTGATCGTGTTTLSGAIYVAAAITSGSGLGAVLNVPSGNALCLTAGTAAAVGGTISYAQF